ncbi:MAG: ABC transporter ATP-binding protein [Phycisphaerae bacterium]
MTRDAPAMLSLDGVRFGFATRPNFLGPITLTIQRGECWAIVGPNGAGKSTLLRLMAGLCKPHAGRVSLGGNTLTEMSGRERARRVAFLPQHPPGDFDLLVREIVLMGRFPHRSLGLFESTEDYRMADRAMEVTETLRFADRPIATLSGGEAQRVHVAAAIAQEPQLLLLDEPTASLDIQHQLAIFQILHDRATRDGLAVVVVTHDVNLAVQFCSHILLLSEGHAVAMGPPSRVLTPEVLGPVYGVELTTLTMPHDPDRRWVVPVETPRGRKS